MTADQIFRGYVRLIGVAPSRRRYLRILKSLKIVAVPSPSPPGPSSTAKSIRARNGPTVISA